VLASLGFGSRLHRSMPCISRWRSQRANRDDDPQPSVGAFGVVSLTHLLDHLACFRRGLIAVLRDPLMGGAVNFEIRDGHEDEPQRTRAARHPNSLSARRRRTMRQPR